MRLLLPYTNLLLCKRLEHNLRNVLIGQTLDNIIQVHRTCPVATTNVQFSNQESTVSYVIALPHFHDFADAFLVNMLCDLQAIILAHIVKKRHL